MCIPHPLSHRARTLCAGGAGMAPVRTQALGSLPLRGRTADREQQWGARSSDPGPIAGTCRQRMRLGRRERRKMMEMHADPEMPVPPAGSFDPSRAADPDPSVWRRMWDSLRRDKVALVGAVIVLAFVLVSAFAPLLAPFDPNNQFN